MQRTLRRARVETTRFGWIEFDPDEVVSFPEGLIGLEHCRKWVLLADAGSNTLGWLQSTERPEMAMAVVSPRRILPDYQLRLSRRELDPLALDDIRTAGVLVVVGGDELSITLNLKAPLVINWRRRIGRQVVASGDAPVTYHLATRARSLKKSA